MPIRNGQAYREALRDNREVWIKGDRVQDVTSHPAFSPTVDAVAQVYEMQNSEEFREVLTTPSATENGRMGLTYKVPRSTEELVQRRKMVETFSRVSGGTLGRLPEYGGAFAIGLLAIRDEIEDANPQSAKAIEEWVNHCRERDLCIASCFVDPQVDKSRPAAETGLLHVVEKERDGIRISGCKSVATLGPASDELLVLTAPRRFSDPDEILYFATPIDTPGLRFICREPIGSGRHSFDHPLSSRFDEPDAWVLFDRVLIPHERVFLNGQDVPPAGIGPYFTKILRWGWYHNLIRGSVKADLLAGVCILLGEYLNTTQYPQVQEEIGEVIAYAETIRSFLTSAEVDSVISNGMASPNPLTISVAKLYALKNYARMLETVRELAGQGIIMAPSRLDLDQPAVGPLISPYYEAHGINAENRIRLFRLAWDIACDSFAGRQMLFELFNAGGITISKLGILRDVDDTRYRELVKELANIDE